MPTRSNKSSIYMYVPEEESVRSMSGREIKMTESVDWGHKVVYQQAASFLTQEQQTMVSLVHLEWCKVASRLVYPIMERSACDLGSSPSLRVLLFAVSEVDVVGLGGWFRRHPSRSG